MKQKIGAQLFTLRDFTKTNEDFELTLKKISDMGMRDYQYSGVTAPHTPEEVKALNEKYNLNLACSHISEARLLSEPEVVAEESIRMGCPTVGLSIYTKSKISTLDDFIKCIFTRYKLVFEWVAACIFKVSIIVNNQFKCLF